MNLRSVSLEGQHAGWRRRPASQNQCRLSLVYGRRPFGRLPDRGLLNCIGSRQWSAQDIGKHRPSISMSSDVELVTASQMIRGPSVSLSRRGTLARARSQPIELDASSDHIDPDQSLVGLPDLPSLAADVPPSISQKKGKQRAVDFAEAEVAVPVAAEPVNETTSSTLKRKTSSKSDKAAGQPKKARVGADGLTAAERKASKAAEAEAKKQFKADNKKLLGRKAALSEIVILASEGCAKHKSFKAALDGLTEDIQLHDHEGKYQPGHLSVVPSPEGISADMAIITYQRVSNKYLDPTTGLFKRYSDGQAHTTSDKHALLLLHASELDELVGEGTLHSCIQDVKRAVGCPISATRDPDWKFMLIVQGLSAYARSEKQESRRKSTYAGLDEALTNLSVLERVFLIRSESSKETQRWLFELSIDIAYKPYKILDRQAIESLGIDGTSKGKASASGSAKGLRTTYVSMLSSMHQITDGQAESIARVYPSFKSLLNAFEAEPSQKGKERLLVGLPMIRNKDGSQTAREIGKDTSKRVYLQLFSKDPHLSMTTMKGL